MPSSSSTELTKTSVYVTMFPNYPDSVSPPLELQFLPANSRFKDYMEFLRDRVVAHITWPDSFKSKKAFTNLRGTVISTLKTNGEVILDVNGEAMLSSCEVFYTWPSQKPLIDKVVNAQLDDQIKSIMTIDLNRLLTRIKESSNGVAHFFMLPQHKCDGTRISWVSGVCHKPNGLFQPVVKCRREKLNTFLKTFNSQENAIALQTRLTEKEPTNCLSELDILLHIHRFSNMVQTGQIKISLLSQAFYSVCFEDLKPKDDLISKEVYNDCLPPKDDLLSEPVYSDYLNDSGAKDNDSEDLFFPW